MSNRTIKVEALARIEGEGGISVKVRDGRVVDVKLNIFEPPRFFEAFLRGRHYMEVPDMVARICGICPAAHQLTSCQAIETALGISVGGQLRDLRRLLYCGEWIESHVLHIAFLHAPDFLGFENALQMADSHGPILKTALRMKKLGNEIVRVIGGREIHPINVRVGGFYKLPAREDLTVLSDELKWAGDAATELLRWAATLEIPDFQRDYELVALGHPDEYAITEGRVFSTFGVNVPVAEYERRFTEEQVPHSNSLHSVLDGQTTYLCGPLARFNLNFRQLTPRCQQAAAAVGLKVGVRNPFASILIRGVETLHVLEEALRLIERYEPPEQPFIEPPLRAGSGAACTEAPRGILFHRYKVSDKGLVQDARIVPPTAQNLRVMEEDLRAFVEQKLSLPQDQLTWKCEQVIRNYDPCISCSAHSLRLKLDRTP